MITCARFESMSAGKNVSEKQFYWILQILGWGSIVVVETINYTFFIIGEFDWEYFFQFGSYALIGLLTSHLYKLLLIRREQFEQRLSKIWLKGILDVLAISFLMVTILYLPAMIMRPDDFFVQKSLVPVLGMVMNLGRYVVVWVIIYYLYRLMKRTREVMEQKLLLENQAKTSELELLKTQLNPHFLFNALNSIKALVLIDQEKARDAIIKLSELLRFSLNYEKEPLIPLKNELDEVEKYLKLEQIRFGNRLTFNIEMEEATLYVKVPPAMVLTLAENAIKHGITNLPDGGEIVILSKIVSDSVRIEMSNSGKLSSDYSLGIGLQNIHKRLHSLFGADAGFELRAQFPERVIAVLEVPIEKIQ